MTKMTWKYTVSCTPFKEREDFRRILIWNHVPIHDPVAPLLLSSLMYVFREFSVDCIFLWKKKRKKIETSRSFDLIYFFYVRYLFWALDGGVGQSFISFGPIEIGVLGLVAPFPDKHAVPNGEHDLLFDLRHDLFRNKSLKIGKNSNFQQIFIFNKFQ